MCGFDRTTVNIQRTAISPGCVHQRPTCSVPCAALHRPRVTRRLYWHDCTDYVKPAMRSLAGSCDQMCATPGCGTAVLAPGCSSELQCIAPPVWPTACGPAAASTAAAFYVVATTPLGLPQRLLVPSCNGHRCIHCSSVCSQMFYGQQTMAVGGAWGA